jgi:hypothetical protein
MRFFHVSMRFLGWYDYTPEKGSVQGFFSHSPGEKGLAKIQSFMLLFTKQH